MNMFRQLKKRWIFSILGCIMSMPLLAHEAPGNRATLVMRDEGHIGLMLQGDLTEVLRRTVAADTAPGAFLAQVSAMSLQEFTALWMRARRQWESEWGLVLPNGTRVRAVQWRGPSAQAAQSALRNLLMQALTDSKPALSANHAPHEHATIEFSADFVITDRQSFSGARTVELQIAPEFAPLRVISYRPQQQSVEAKNPRIRIGF